MDDRLAFRDECYRIIGACLAVYKDQGNGFGEPVYQDVMEIGDGGVAAPRRAVGRPHRDCEIVEARRSPTSTARKC